MQFAAVFPGQGSQSLGMLAELATEYPEIKNTFDEASDVLSCNLWEMTTADSDEIINQTINTQPIMLAAGVAVWRIWQKVGGCVPVAMAGHSLGEYSALVASGSVTFRDAVKLVATRAKLMQEAVPVGVGAMAAVLGLEDQKIIDICSDLSNKGVVEKRAVKLAMSVPSHCSLLEGAAKELNLVLSETEFLEADFPIIQNVTAKNYEVLEDRKKALSEQLYKPVLWVDCIKSLSENYSADTIIEFGPGKVLFGLNRRIDRSLGNICVNDLASLDKALTMCGA